MTSSRRGLSLLLHAPPQLTQGLGIEVFAQLAVQFPQLFYAALERDGFKPVRDRNEMRPGDRISAFIRRLTRADLVVAVISDKYLRSSYCMHEIHGLWQKSQEDADLMVEREGCGGDRRREFGPACAPWERWRLAGIQMNWAEGPAVLTRGHGQQGGLGTPNEVGPPARSLECRRGRQRSQGGTLRDGVTCCDTLPRWSRFAKPKPIHGTRQSTWKPTRIWPPIWRPRWKTATPLLSLPHWATSHALGEWRSRHPRQGLLKAPVVPSTGEPPEWKRAIEEEASAPLLASPLLQPSPSQGGGTPARL